MGTLALIIILVILFKILKPILSTIGFFVMPIIKFFFILILILLALAFLF
jgi:hypothetical protein